MGLDDSKTLLSADDKQGLIPRYISTREELNLLECENIMKASKWLEGQATTDGWEGILDQRFIKKLHKKMFEDVWRWAGLYRTTDTNIGVPNQHITTQIHQLFGDIEYWCDRNLYNITEAAIIFHHRLVKIHPFVDGNGRHARLLAGWISSVNGGKELTWGRNLHAVIPREIRKRYIEAIHEANRDNYDKLIAFATS